MYEALKSMLREARKPGQTQAETVQALKDAALEATILRPNEDFVVKLALFISCSEDLFESRTVTRDQLCDIAKEMSERKVRLGKSLDMRLSASLRRTALCK